MTLTALIGWIILGALAGWVASMIMGTDAKQGGLANIVVGIVGAFIGGFIANLLGFSGASGLNLWSFVVALGGSVVLLAVVRAFSRAR